MRELIRAEYSFACKCEERRRRMIIQYGIRSLLLASVFLSLLLSLCYTSRILMGESSFAVWLSDHSCLYVIVSSFSFAGAPIFWLALLMPCWLPALFVTASSGRERLWPYLNLLPAAWYLALISIHESSFMVSWPISTKTFALMGTVAAMLLLCITSRRGLYIFSVPLAFAITSGALWTLVAFP